MKLSKEDIHALKVISDSTDKFKYALVPCCFTKLLDNLSESKLIDIISNCPPLDVKVIVTEKGRNKLKELSAPKPKIIKKLNKT